MDKVRTVIEWELLHTGGVPFAPAIQVSAAMSWTEHSPLEVHIVFETGGEPVEWVFARDILDDAIQDFTETWQGTHDVKARTQTGTLELWLTSPFGTAVFTTSAWNVVTFLHKTYELSPRGKEEIFIPDTLEGLLP